MAGQRRETNGDFRAAVRARYVKLVALSEVRGNPFASAAESMCCGEM